MNFMDLLIIFRFFHSQSAACEEKLQISPFNFYRIVLQLISSVAFLMLHCRHLTAGSLPHHKPALSYILPPEI
jgi:hypothetical protein